MISDLSLALIDRTDFMQLLSISFLCIASTPMTKEAETLVTPAQLKQLGV